MQPEADSLLRSLSSLPGLNPLNLHPELFAGRPMPGLDKLVFNIGEDMEQEEIQQG